MANSNSSSNISWGSTTSSNTTISGQHTHQPYLNSGGSYGNGMSYSDSYDIYDLDDKCLDLEKLERMSTVKRDMIFEIFIKFIDCTTEPQKGVLYNTLKPYNVIVDTNKLERKIKIDSVLSKNESDE